MDTDRAARRSAQTEFERPLIVEAGAGTGKTTVLAGRIVGWTLGPGWEEEATPREAARLPVASPGAPETAAAIAARVLEGVAAITFTEAAAAEMSSRVAAFLAAFAGGAEDGLAGVEADLVAPGTDPGERRRRARALLGALDHLTVRTIHSFCLGLLQRHPLAAGLHPRLRVDPDGRLLDELVDRVVERQVTSLASEPDPPLARLALHGLGPRRAADALRQLALAGLPAATLAADPFAAPRLAALGRRLLETLERFTAATRSLVAVAGAPLATKTLQAAAGTREVAERLARDGDGRTQPPYPALAFLLEQLETHWTDRLLERLGDWRRERFTATERQALGQDVAATARAAGELLELLRHLLRLDPELFAAARAALAPLLADLEGEQRAAGVIGFQGLLVEARRLLAERPGVRSRERRRLRQLLVDEFQDTDRLQCELIALLALDGPAAERPGLFVVGDPKQSIYGWRNADLEAYRRFLERALAAGGRRCLLDRNFRSPPVLLEETERVVAPVMVEVPGVQPVFQPLAAGRDPAAGEGFRRGRWAPVEYWVSWDPDAGPDTDAETAARLEAEAVAADLLALHRDGGLAWREFGLLFRSMHRLDNFLEALRRRGIPFDVSRDRQYYQRREVIDAAALVRAVLSPADHLALLTFLRSPAVGVPDAALLPLWRHGFPGLMTELEGPDPARLAGLRQCVRRATRELPAGIPGLDRIRGWESSLERAIEDLAVLRRAFLTEPADRFVEQLRRRTLVEAIEGARYLGAYRLANLDRFFRRLGEALEQRASNAPAVLRALRRAVAETEEAEEAAPRQSGEDAVRVTTIHGAKGLEFGHVYLVQLHAEAGRGEARAADPGDTEAGGGEWVRAGPDDGGARDALTGPGPHEYALFGAPTPGFDRVEARRRRVEAAERVRTLYVGLTRARERLVLAGRWPARAEPRAPSEARTHLALVAHRRGRPDRLDELFDRCRSAGLAHLDAGGARWRFPGLSAEPGGSADRPPVPEWLPSPRQIAEQAAALAGRQQAAGQHMRRPFHRTAAAGALAELERVMAWEATGTPGEGGAREVALAVGAVVHRLLETWRVDADPEDELERQRPLLEARLRVRLRAAQLDAARRRAAELLDRLAHGHLLARLTALGPHLLARELPVLAPPEPGEDAPVGFLSGSVDLLYRDPANNRLVIADYKTDRVDPGPELERRAAAYAAQEATYARAVQQALHLDHPPRLELWFLWPDLIWETAA